jgi:fucose permease
MSAGVVTSPLVAGLFISRGYGYSLFFLIMAGIALAAAVIIFAVRIPVSRLGEGFSRRVLGELLGPHRMTLSLILALGILYMTAEAVPNNWIPQYLRDVFPGSSVIRSRVVLSLFWAAVTVGRQLCAILLRRWKPHLLTVVLSAGAALSLCAASLMRSSLGAEAAFVATGLFLSGVMPVILALSGRMPGEAAGASFVLILAVGMLGASGMNRVVGGVSDLLGFRAGILTGAVPLAGAILIFLLARDLRRSG